MPVVIVLAALIWSSGSALAQTYGDDLSPVLTVCDQSAGQQMSAEVGTTKDFAGLSSSGQCTTATTTPDNNYEFCPNPFLISFIADSTSDNRFECTESLAEYCGASDSTTNNCPTGTECIYTTDYADDSTFWSCGVVCGYEGDSQICSDAGAKLLNGNYVTYCDTISDQCGICSSANELQPGNTDTGGCATPVSAYPATSSGTWRKRAQMKALDMASVENLGCPTGTKKCGTEDSFECVDVMNDLHSCGSCPNEGGIRCDTLPGIIMGDITCQAGLCTSTTCAEGYELWERSCVLPSVAASFREIASRSPTPVSVEELSIQKKKAESENAFSYPIANRKDVAIKHWQTVEIIGQ
ncbi:hypothetical protein BD324DRAFT_652413 [Kockovaella imperatae]|uniref:Protein CPL1-like domain-containing protein n=1 Tax=Kockovaella imperatae TaxID=4999 RepID=A0A1Y1UCN2_9TREE|nr:hypothetical protein BD324DRAFT_652413 [Kockovaella imperatae]ORX35274.1 hypothetical protein BD324DRAFT_652413 [Kockovaella imperatae]